MKLLLTSFMTSPEQDQALAELIGKAPHETKVAYIENAYDVYDDEESLLEGRELVKAKGYDVELVDLREWQDGQAGLREILAGKDMFLLTGGNPYYLRWLMKATGADEMITELVEQGKVYCGASAAAVVAGPTLRFFDVLDDPDEAGEIIYEGLYLTDIVVVPHTDNEEFGEGCRAAGEQLEKARYATQWITDTQAFLIDGDRRAVI